VQFAITTEVEQSESRVAALLDLGDYQPGTDRVNCASRNDKRFSRVDHLAMHEVGHRAVDDGRSKLRQ